MNRKLESTFRYPAFFCPVISAESFIRTLTLSWWIPMLFILAMRRYVYRRFPLKYDPLYWGAIFPLGMYTACTFQMVRAMELEFLNVIPRYFVYIALSAWLAAFARRVYILVGSLIAFICKRNNAKKV